MRLILLVVGLLGLAALSVAHPTSIAAARAKVGADGSVEMHVRFDVLAYVLDQRPADVDDAAMRELLHVPVDALGAQIAEAAQRFQKGLQILGDTGQVTATVTYPTATDIGAWRQSNGEGQLPVMMTAIVRTSPATGSKKISFRFPEALDTVILTVEFPYQEPISEPVESGTASRWLTIPTPSQVATVAKEIAKDTEKRAAPATPKQPAAKPKPPKLEPSPSMLSSLVEQIIESEITPPTPVAKKPEPRPEAPPSIAEGPSPAAPPNQSSPWYSSITAYVRLGFVHIVPHGLDHILFVLGLFLLSSKWKDLLKQVTAFTIAHSLTLALAMLGILRLPATIVEPLIAASIVFIAVENIFATKMSNWRPYVVFGFGLMHGLGFAGVLQDAGLQNTNLLTALLGFNIGVELGQLAVIAGAGLLVGWFRSNDRYRPMVAIPASVAIALVAITWTVQRLL